MKVCMFHLMPYRDLPSDFVSRYNSAFIDPPWFDVANSEKVGEYYNSTLDELLYAAKAGFHGVCTNQHHQNVYGFMANPSLMGAVLAKETNGQNIAIVQLGSTLPSTTPPTRIAEEYAMLDCISGGRLVAGFPTGLPSDAVISQRHRADRAARALPRGAGAGAQGVVGARGFRLERQALSARHGQPVAAADPAAASAGVDSGLRLFLHRRICRRARPLLLSPELFRRQERQGGDRPLLGPRGEQGPRRQSVSLEFFAAHRRRRDRRRGRRSLRRARRVFLPQAALLAAALSGDPGLPRIRRAGADSQKQSARRGESARAQGQGFL